MFYVWMKRGYTLSLIIYRYRWKPFSSYAFLIFWKNGENIFYRLNIQKNVVLWHLRKSKVNVYVYTNTFNNDSGIIFNWKMNFDQHRNYVIASAQTALRLVKGTLENQFSIRAAKMFCFSIVRCKLEYCSVLWNPHQICHSSRTESIQKKFFIVVARCDITKRYCNTIQTEEIQEIKEQK